MYCTYPVHTWNMVLVVDGWVGPLRQASPGGVGDISPGLVLAPWGLMDRDILEVLSTGADGLVQVVSCVLVAGGAVARPDHAEGCHCWSSRPSAVSRASR